MLNGVALHSMCSPEMSTNEKQSKEHRSWRTFRSGSWERGMCEWVVYVYVENAHNCQHCNSFNNLIFSFEWQRSLLYRNIIIILLKCHYQYCCCHSCWSGFLFTFSLSLSLSLPRSRSVCLSYSFYLSFYSSLPVPVHGDGCISGIGLSEWDPVHVCIRNSMTG